MHSKKMALFNRRVTLNHSKCTYTPHSRCNSAGSKREYKYRELSAGRYSLLVIVFFLSDSFAQQAKLCTKKKKRISVDSRTENCTREGEKGFLRPCWRLSKDDRLLTTCIASLCCFPIHRPRQWSSSAGVAQRSVNIFSQIHFSLICVDSCRLQSAPVTDARLLSREPLHFEGKDRPPAWRNDHRALGTITCPDDCARLIFMAAPFASSNHEQDQIRGNEAIRWCGHRPQWAPRWFTRWHQENREENRARGNKTLAFNFIINEVCGRLKAQVMSFVILIF